MTHVANQRIKKDGKSYLPGDTIELTEDELAELPEEAVSLADVAARMEPALSDEQRAERLTAAVAGLTDADFRKDGVIRAESLRQLIETLGFEVTAEAVAEQRTESGSKEQN